MTTLAEKRASTLLQEEYDRVHGRITGVTSEEKVAIQGLTAGEYITGDTLHANSILKADVDHTPIELLVAAEALVGRTAVVDGGVITDLSPSEVRTMLNIDQSTGRYRYAAAIADDATTALPTITANYAGGCEVIVSSSGVIDANATFMVDSTGTVTPQVDSGNVVYNADTDTKLCIGTAAAQNPLTIKNRLGGAKNIMINFRYN